jgi:hypothetical protein
VEVLTDTMVKLLNQHDWQLQQANNIRGLIETVKFISKLGLKTVRSENRTLFMVQESRYAPFSQ